MISANNLNEIAASFDTLRQKLPIEKTYIQFDKPYYTSGDTIWMKAYLFKASHLEPAESGILYIELANDTNKVIQRRMMPVYNGLGYGNIPLNKNDIPEGSYILRAYTNLQRNFAEDYVFKKSFYISSASSESWLVNSKVGAEKDSVHLALSFSKADKSKLALKELELKVMEGKRVLSRDKVQTDIDGLLDVNFKLNEKADKQNISIVLQDKNEKGFLVDRMSFPVIIQNTENIDLQFMPEGGELVAGLKSRVGFKAIGEDGLGTEVKGGVYSNNGSNPVSEFISLHKGMGSFEFIPLAGESYQAKITLADGTIKSYPLPAVKNSGIVLQVMNQEAGDSIKVIVSATADKSSRYYLIGQSRGIVCYGAAISLTGNTNTRSLSKDLFPTGITRFTLLDANKQPLNERIFFIDHQDNLNISVNTDRENYGPRDSIALNIRVTDKNNDPVQGSFSIAVTDDGQIKIDSLSNNILSNILLTSDLKGTVEQPGYYFNTDNENRLQALDNLLLTQGWVGYEWRLMNKSQSLAFELERELLVKGRVINIFNKGVEGSRVILLSSKPAFFMDTVSNLNGDFIFKELPITDTIQYVIQATNKRDNSFNIGIVIEDFKAPEFAANENKTTPWYLNSNAGIITMIDAKVVQRKDEARLVGANVLQEVVINAKKIIKDSKNLNGPGGADIVLDEKYIESEPKLTLYEMLEKRFSNSFRRGAAPGTYYLLNHTVNLVIDGVFIKSARLPVALYMDYLVAEDIKGIEIMNSAKYGLAYDPDIISKSIRLKDHMLPIFLEITTHSGHGAFMKKVPGVYLYKAMPFVAIKGFYRPRYTSKDAKTSIDYRPTLHWEPNIITGPDGKATISFYSSDRTGSYTAVIEGTDMNGSVGNADLTIKIE